MQKIKIGYSLSLLLILILLFTLSLTVYGEDSDHKKTNNTDVVIKALRFRDKLIVGSGFYRFLNSFYYYYSPIAATAIDLQKYKDRGHLTALIITGINFMQGIGFYLGAGLWLMAFLLPLPLIIPRMNPWSRLIILIFLTLLCILIAGIIKMNNITKKPYNKALVGKAVQDITHTDLAHLSDKINYYLRSSNNEVVYEVIFYIGINNILCCEDKMISLLNHNDPRIRLWASTILGNMKSSNAVPYLINMLDDSVFNVRSRAAESLGNIGDKRAIAKLRELSIYDPYIYVRSSAYFSINKILNKP